MPEWNRRICILLITVGAGFILSRPAGSSAQPEPWEAPEDARSIENPIKANRASLDRGAELYRLNCLACHGPLGAGDGPSRDFIEMNPPDLHDPQWGDNQTDGEIFWKISSGRLPMMPYEGYLEEADRWNLVNFIKTLKGLDTPPPIRSITPVNPQISGEDKVDINDGKKPLLDSVEIVLGLIGLGVFMFIFIAWKRKARKPS